jgi:UPF0716 protein FxsA
MGRLLPLFLWPLAEIAAFVVIGGTIGVGGVILAVIAGGFAGVAVLRRSGARAVDALHHGSQGASGPAAEAAMDGAWMALAGALLIIPGFISDAVALALLLPPVRRWLVRNGRRPIAMSGINISVGGFGWRQEPGRRAPDGAPVIDGEFHKIGEREIDGGTPPDHHE